MKNMFDSDCPNKGLFPSGAGLYKVMLELLERRDKLEPLAKEFARLDFALKRYFQGVPDFRIGGYQIKGFYCENSRLKIPEKIKNKYLKKERTWIVSINKIKK
ncbi:MAG: hypothetical protein ACI352_01900 [Elusimicrobiaceae bacterium]|nr:hypothetical protein [Elusimicrobiota bacterium]